MTGLSAVIGSWKIIAIRLPRIARIARRLSVSRSVPSNRMLPGHDAAGRRGTRRMIDSAVTHLPQPVSPTTPSVSPRSSDERHAVDRA